MSVTLSKPNNEALVTYTNSAKSGIGFSIINEAINKHKQINNPKAPNTLLELNPPL